MNQKISLAILAKVAAGMSIEAAVDAVLGAGSFTALAGSLYDALKAVRS